MPMLDWSATAAWIALIIAIISPFVTALITNKYTVKIKQWELFESRKLSVIENYLKAASNAAYTDGVPIDFAEFSMLIFLYAPSEIHQKIAELNNALEGDAFVPEVMVRLTEVSIALRHEAKIR